MILCRSFFVCLTCLFWGLEESEVYSFPSHRNSGSESTVFNGSNTSRKALFSAFLFPSIPTTLGGIAQPQVLNPIVPFILVDMVNPRAIWNQPLEHCPNQSVEKVFGSSNAQLLVRSTSILLEDRSPSFGIMSSGLPCLEMSQTGEFINRSRPPIQYSSFGVVCQEPVKLISVGNFLAFGTASEYPVFSVCGHFSDRFMVADVEPVRVSFPETGSPHFPTSSLQVNP